MRSPVGILSCIVLGLLKQPTKFNLHIGSPKWKVQKKGNAAACGLTKKIWIIYKFELTQDFFQDNQEHWLYFIMLEKSLTLLLSPRPNSQLAQQKASKTNEEILMPIMIKALQFSEITFTYKMLLVFILNKNGHIT